METNLKVAETILTQLAGPNPTGKLRAMIGGKDFSGGANSVQFKWTAKAKNRANCLRVELDPLDTYIVEFWKVGRGATDPTMVKKFDTVYAEDLRKLFERETGLYISI